MSSLWDSPCRLCADLCNPEIGQIFSNENIFLVDLIEKYLSIKITAEDILPIQICEVCRLKLVSFDEYATNCSSTQITLSALSLENKKIELDCSILDSVKTEYDPDDLEEFNCPSIKSETEDFSFTPISGSLEKKHKQKSKRIKLKNSSKHKRNINLDPADFLTKKIKSKTLSSDKKSKNPKISNSFLSYTCHVCSEIFNSWSLLEKHTVSTHSTKPMITCVCDKYLRSKNAVYAHILKHDKTAYQYTCEICKKGFVTEKNYKHHLLTHETKRFQCDKCEMNFQNRYFLKTHLKIHDPLGEKLTYPCNICGFEFSAKHSVKKHIQNVHKKEKSHICDICGMSFYNKGGLTDHSARHSSDKPYACPHCPKSYKTRSTFKKHLDCHSGIKHKCDKCPAEFNYKKTLQQHMFVHEDVYRFVCSVCDKGFKWKRSYQTHMNIHSGETPFSCPWCPKTFADGPNCRVHKKRNHALELALYEANKGITKRTEIEVIDCPKPVKPSEIRKKNLKSIG